MVNGFNMRLTDTGDGKVGDWTTISFIVRSIHSSFIAMRSTLPTEKAKESMASWRRVISSEA
jgi:hypothetical protein